MKSTEKLHLDFQPNRDWLPVACAVATARHREALRAQGRWRLARAILESRGAEADRELWAQVRAKGSLGDDLLTLQALRAQAALRFPEAGELLELVGGRGPLGGLARDLEVALGILNDRCGERRSEPAKGPAAQAREMDGSPHAGHIQRLFRESGAEELEVLRLRAVSAEEELLLEMRLAGCNLRERRFLSAARRLRSCRGGWRKLKLPDAAMLAGAGELLAWMRMERWDKARELREQLVAERHDGRLEPEMLFRLEERLEELDAGELRREACFINACRHGRMVGCSPPFRRLLRELEETAAGRRPVLLVGATGPGKELAAAYIHELSGGLTRGRGNGEAALLRLNCAAIPHQLFESELFGCARGAFTGAVERAGLVETAAGGTLLLDEFGAMPATLQVKFLRFLESGEYYRVGEARPRRTELRVVAATNEGPRLDGADFRQDLLHRVTGHRIGLPPLRERPEDLPLLLRAFLLENRRPPAGHPLLDTPVLERLAAHPWPGNIRELRFVALRLGPVPRKRLHERLERELRPRRSDPAGTCVPFALPGRSLREITLQAERQALVGALTRCGDDKKLAAQSLGISLPTLYAKLKRWGPDLDSASAD